MANVGYATLQVVPSFKGIDSRLRKGVTGAGRTSGGVFGGSFNDGARRSIIPAVGRLATGVAGIFAAIGAARFFSGAFDEAEEAMKVGAQTTQVITSTGGAAQVTAGQVEALATALSLKAGIDDELVQSGANMLLTFTNIRNEVGEGNDIFDQATETALDLSVAFGQDMKSSAIQLGKALNDPIKGVTALGRVGVQFTDDQKETIKSLVETGDILGAQKVILGEITKQVGGSATAQATAADRIRVAWANLQERVGTFLMPVFERLAYFTIQEVIPALEKIGEAISFVVKRFKRGGLGSILTLFGKQLDKLGPAGRAVHDVFEGIAVAADAVEVAVRSVVEWFDNTGLPIIEKVVDSIREQWDNLASWTRKNWDQISEAVGHVLVAIRTIVAALIIPIIVTWKLFGDEIMRVVRAAWNFVIEIVRAALQILGGVIRFFLALINGDWGRAWQALKDTFGGIWDAITAALRVAWNVIVSTLSAGLSVLSAVWSAAWAAIGAALSVAWNAMVGVVTAAVNAVYTVATYTLGLLASAIGGIWDGLYAVWDVAWSNLVGLVTAAIDAIKGVYNAFARTWNAIEISIPKVHIPGTNVDVGGGNLGLPDLPELHQGGIFQAASGGEGLALLRNGEGVFTPEQMRVLRDGRQMDSLNTRPFVLNINGDIYDGERFEDRVSRIADSLDDNGALEDAMSMRANRASVGR